VQQGQHVVGHIAPAVLSADFTFEEADALLDAGSSDTCERARRNLGDAPIVGDVMTLGAVLAARADVGAVA
jgi:hypothetical protein